MWNEPDEAEFLSALAAGRNAWFMVMACTGVAGPTTLTLAAAARQTGGRVVCDCRGQNKLQASRKALGVHGDSVELVVGDPKTLLLNDYKGADFVLVDYDMVDSKDVFLAAFKEAKRGEALVVGYNARHRASWLRQLKTASFLPIGEGLLVVTTKMDPKVKFGKVEQRKRSRWIVKVDKCIGEEHIFRVISV